MSTFLYLIHLCMQKENLVSHMLIQYTIQTAVGYTKKNGIYNSDVKFSEGVIIYFATSVHMVVDFEHVQRYFYIIRTQMLLQHLTEFSVGYLLFKV